MYQISASKPLHNNHFRAISGTDFYLCFIRTCVISSTLQECSSVCLYSSLVRGEMQLITAVVHQGHLTYPCQPIYLLRRPLLTCLIAALCFVDLTYVLDISAFDSLAVCSGRMIVQSAGVAFDGTLKRAPSAADILSEVIFLELPVTFLTFQCGQWNDGCGCV